MIELRVPTVALTAEVACANGHTLAGRIFIPAASHYSGPMRPEDWINEPLPFFPFLPDDAAVPVILNKHTVIMVTLPGIEGTECEVLLGLERRVAIECGEKRIEGLLHIDMPQNLQRVQDDSNRCELFLDADGRAAHHLVQKHHITRVIEIGEE